MPKKKTSATNNRILDTALRLAAKRPWKEITLAEIAGADKHFSSKHEILTALVVQFDEEVESFFRTPPKGTPRDRLFEVLMARFDILQNHRASILSIMDSARADPSLLRTLVPAQIKTMRKMLQLAKLTPDGPQEFFVIGGLLAVYAAALRTWHKDASKDMAPTMAILDKALRYADMCAEKILRA